MLKKFKQSAVALCLPTEGSSRHKKIHKIELHLNYFFVLNCKRFLIKWWGRKRFVNHSNFISNVFFFLVYSLMIKWSSFSLKLQNAPQPHPLQFSSKEYIQNMASCITFTFETTKNISVQMYTFAEGHNVYLNILKTIIPFHFSGHY